MKQKYFSLIVLLFVQYFIFVPLAAQNIDTLRLRNSFNPNIKEVLGLKGKENNMDNIEVITASRSVEKATNAPATIYVITEEQIKRRNYTSLDEVLADIPEIEIQRNANPEFSNIYTVRGISGNDKFVILQDGIRISAATASPHTVGHNFMVQHVKQIEIMLGPASALYGADAFAGIVNMITKVGKDYTGVSISTSYGRFNTTDNNITVGIQAKEASILAFGKYFYSQQANLPEFYPQDFKWYNDVYKQTGEVRASLFDPTALQKVGYQPFAMPLIGYNAGLRLNMGGLEFGASLSQETHSSANSDKPEFATYTPDNKYITNLATIDMAYKRRFNKLNSRTVFIFNNFSLGNHTKFTNVYSAYNAAYKHSNETTFQFEQQFSYAVSEKTEINAGLLYQNFVVLPKTNDLPVPFESNNYLGLYYLGTNVKDVNGNSLAIRQDFYWLNYFNLGGYAQLKTSLANTLNLTVGLRYDYNSRFEGNFNPRLGLVYFPLEKLTFKLLYGESFLAASPYSAYQHYGSFVPLQDNAGNFTGFKSFFYHLPNPDLKAEKNRSIETSIRYKFSNKISLMVDVYYNRWSEIISNSYRSNVLFKDYLVETAEISVNSGTANIYGGTARLETKHSIGKLSLLSTWAYTYNEGNKDGKPLSLSAAHTVKGLVELGYGKFSLVPKVLYRSSSLQPQLTDANKNPIKNPEFVVIDLIANCQIIKNGRIFVKVNNLLDNRYYHVSNTGLSSLELSPQAPLTWLLGVNVTF
jgi:outer membrane receptor for ferrienterochelin and colicin